MDENEAIILLGKLKDFMENTNKQIQTLAISVHNQQIDIDKLKKNLSQNRIIVRN
jgi:hypothetical protein